MRPAQYGQAKKIMRQNWLKKRHKLHLSEGHDCLVIYVVIKISQTFLITILVLSKWSLYIIFPHEVHLNSARIQHANPYNNHVQSERKFDFDKTG